MRKIIQIFYVLMIFTGCTSQQRSVIQLKTQNRSGYLIPIEIDGHVMNFLWDTGSVISSVSRSFVDSVGIPVSNKTVDVNAALLESTTPFVLTEKIDVKIGDHTTQCKFAIDDYNILPSDIVGIIGMDIIEKYSWLFDNVRSCVSISEEDQDVAFDSNKEVSCTFAVRDLSYCNLSTSINDSIEEQLFFDSGMMMSCYNLGEEMSLCSDFRFYVNSPADEASREKLDTYFRQFWSKTSDISLYVGGMECNMNISENLNLNGLAFDNVLFDVVMNSSSTSRFPKKLDMKSMKDVRVVSILTYFFLERFSRFYFSYDRRELTLIKSKDQKDKTTLLLEQIFREAKLYDK